VELPEDLAGELGPVSRVGPRDLARDANDCEIAGEVDGMFTIPRAWLGALALTVLGGLLFPSEVPTQERPVASTRMLIQQGSFARALEILSAEDPAGNDDGHLFQRAYCLQQLRRWRQAAEIYLRLLPPDVSPDADDSQHQVPSEDASWVGASGDQVNNDHVINDYVLFFAATCLLHSQEYAAAEAHLQTLLSQSGSLLTTEARELLGQLYLSWEKPHQAIEVYGQLLAEFSGRDEQARFSYALAEAYRQAGRLTEAAVLLEGIIRDYPSSREALSALSAYRSLPAGKLSGEMLYRAGWVYFHHGRYEEAAEAWERFLHAHPRHELAPEALFLSARASFREGRYDLARERCGRLLSAHPRGALLTSARFLLARCDEGEGLTGAAVERYRQFVETYPWSQLADDALWRLARIHERDGNLAVAEREYWHLSQQYASRQDADLALWRAGLYAFFRGDTRTALSRLNRFLRRQAGGAQIQGAMYWIARAHLAEGQRDQAVREMRKVIEWDEDGYYADRARSWLNIPADPVTLHRETITAVFSDLVAESPAGPPQHLWLRLRKGQELVRLGMLSRARRELSVVRGAAHEHPAVMTSLLQLYEEYQLYGDVLRLTVSLQAHRPESRVRDRLWPYLYPRGYQEVVAAEAENYHLDPYLILALVRTESLFDPLAESSAGARGLMQIMPATGREIARKLGAPSEDASSFFAPEWNIRMGVYYLWQQYQAYHGQVQFALAAYNAGPGNTNRWLRRLQGVDPDLFVELIDFSETRQFIKKVLAAQVRYQRIWEHAG
jgi:soluble lytic murein transglycosylase